MITQIKNKIVLDFSTRTFIVKLHILWKITKYAHTFEGSFTILSSYNLSILQKTPLDNASSNYHKTPKRDEQLQQKKPSMRHTKIRKYKRHPVGQVRSLSRFP